MTEQDYLDQQQFRLWRLTVVPLPLRATPNVYAEWHRRQQQQQQLRDQARRDNG